MFGTLVLRTWAQTEMYPSCFALVIIVKFYPCRDRIRIFCPSGVGCKAHINPNSKPLAVEVVRSRCGEVGSATPILHISILEGQLSTLKWKCRLLVKSYVSIVLCRPRQSSRMYPISLNCLIPKVPYPKLLLILVSIAIYILKMPTANSPNWLVEWHALNMWELQEHGRPAQCELMKEVLATARGAVNSIDLALIVRGHGLAQETQILWSLRHQQIEYEVTECSVIM